MAKTKMEEAKEKRSLVKKVAAVATTVALVALWIVTGGKSKPPMT